MNAGKPTLIQPVTGNMFSTVSFYTGVASILLLFTFSMIQINNLNNGSTSQDELKKSFSLTLPVIGGAIGAAVVGFFLFSKIEISAPFKYNALWILASMSFFLSVLAIVLSSTQVTLK